LHQGQEFADEATNDGIIATTPTAGWFMTYAFHTTFVYFRFLWEVVMQFQLATAVAVMGLITVVAVYFVWVRKFGKSDGEQKTSQP
jgi:hypothetical protein